VSPQRFRWSVSFTADATNPTHQAAMDRLAAEILALAKRYDEAGVLHNVWAETWIT
jgi:hypothetical protein